MGSQARRRPPQGSPLSVSENEAVVPEKGRGRGFYGKNKHQKYNLVLEHLLLQGWGGGGLSFLALKQILLLFFNLPFF